MQCDVILSIFAHGEYLEEEESHKYSAKEVA
jgi:hypothetical protein